LAEHRGRRNPAALPPLSVQQILAWADEHHRETGTWPTGDSGPVKGAAEETWRGIETALRQGWRGFPGGSSLAKLLAEHHTRHRDTADLPCLTVRRILAWADAHHERSGRWPNEQSGLVYHAAGETWAGINVALRAGTRGLRGGSSLVELLAKQRGVPRRLRSPPLTAEQILTWADRHHDRTGDWPRVQSGIADKESGLTWAAIDIALQRGLRGLPGASSLHKLLVQERGVSRKPGSLR
jgi:hypothetical protein